MSEGRLSGKVALITGAGSGIGQATALRFAVEGASVISTDINLQSAETTVDLIKKQAGQAHSLRLDVADADQVSAAIERCVDLFGHLDVVFNNAGGSWDWDQTIAVNLTGVFNGLSLSAQYLAESGGGAIVNTASVAGLVGMTRPHEHELDGMESRSAYVASKHGVVGLTRQFAVTYGRFGVRVNAIAPGYVETPLLEQIREDVAALSHLTSLHPMGRLGQPHEVAAAACFLASEDASFINGAILPVDGGYTAR